MQLSPSAVSSSSNIEASSKGLFEGSVDENQTIVGGGGPSKFVQKSISRAASQRPQFASPGTQQTTTASDWSVAFAQAEAYKKFKAHSKKEQVKKESLTETPGTKAKKDEESLAAYRKWKSEQQKLALESKKQSYLQRKEEERGAATVIGRAFKKRMSAAPVSPILPASEPKDPRTEKGSETSFSTSATTTFLKEVMVGESHDTHVDSAEPESEGAAPSLVDSNADVDADANADESALPNIIPGDLDEDIEPESDAESDVEDEVVEMSHQILETIDQNVPSAWPEILDDESTLNLLPSLLQSNEEIYNDVVNKKQVVVRVITWNQQAKTPPPLEELKDSLFPDEKFHIIAIGTEECENSIAKSIIVHSKKKWEDAVEAAAGENYVKLRSHTLQATHNMVLVHKSIMHLCDDANSGVVATGIALGRPVGSKQQLGNKGGIGICFDIGKTSFLFVNAHLAAHQKAAEKRNAEFARISKELVQSLRPDAPQPNGESNPLLDGFAHIFWAGDLNYRINGTRAVVDVLLEKEMHEVLLNNDQLNLAMKTNSAFDGFAEGPLNFKPTYKFDKNSDIYDTSKKMRIPSWTDRILFKKESSSKLVNYASATSIRTSDHRPVYSTFICDVDGDFGSFDGLSQKEYGVTKSQVCSIS